MSSVILKRLEAVASRLENYASSLGGGGGSSSSSSSSGGGSASVAPIVAAYDAFLEATLPDFIVAAEYASETKELAGMASEAFNFARVVIEASTVFKKPKDQDLMKFLGPIVKVVTDAQSVPGHKSEEYFKHQKGFASGVQCFNAFLVGPPGTTARGAKEEADFYLTPILTAAKKLGDDPKASQYRAFSNSLSSLLEGFVNFWVKNAKAGLTWNGKGDALDQSYTGSNYTASSSGGSAPPPPAAGPPPSAPPPSAAPAPSASSSSGGGGGGGMGAVFGELTSKAGSLTKNFKHVTKDMKTKNMKDRKSTVPSKKTPVKKTTKLEKKKVQKPPELALKKGTWFASYQVENCSVDELTKKEDVYVLKPSNNAVVNIPGKCKGVQIDGANRASVVVNAVISSVEIFNCQRLKLYCQGIVPTVAIDKSDGVQVFLSREAYQSPPNFVVSKHSEINVVIPGATEDDDDKELPVVEQFQCVLEDGKLVTEPMVHGD